METQARRSAASAIALLAMRCERERREPRHAASRKCRAVLARPAGKRRLDLPIEHDSARGKQRGGMGKNIKRGVGPLSVGGRRWDIRNFVPESCFKLSKMEVTENGKRHQPPRPRPPEPS